MKPQNKLQFSKTQRSSHSQKFFKINVFKNFENFTGKRLCWSFFFNKVAGLSGNAQFPQSFGRFARNSVETVHFHKRPATLLKRRLQHRRVLVKFAKFLRTPFLQSISNGCFWKLKSMFSVAKKVVEVEVFLQGSSTVS